jgi:glycosyltransferase involved in cell wall biosynthesis
VRIAITNWSCRHVGGTETYLSQAIAALHAAGHAVAFWCEIDAPANRARLPFPADVPVWSMDRLGRHAALAALREWAPDVVYSHGLMDPALASETAAIAPAVHFAHAYHGTCISGAKTHKRPVTRPCSRRFGWSCLLHFYPHRCGGLSPLTMIDEFTKHRARLALIARCRALVVLSEHMRREYIRHGLRPERIYNVSGTRLAAPGEGLSAEAVAEVEESRDEGGPLRLVFAGRMDYLKGGRTLIAALPQVADTLRRPVSLIFIGDGPDRPAWEAIGRRLAAARSDLTVAFESWRDGEDLNRTLADQHLLVVPSLWPEPFGRIGLEAGRHGVPAAAFDVGGISEWLHDGVNGRLAPGDPPTASGLARAIVGCVEDPRVHARLRAGARRLARAEENLDHAAQLTRIFAEALADDRPLS